MGNLAGRTNKNYSIHLRFSQPRFRFAKSKKSKEYGDVLSLLRFWCQESWAKNTAARVRSHGPLRFLTIRRSGVHPAGALLLDQYADGNRAMSCRDRKFCGPRDDLRYTNIGAFSLTT